MIFRRIMIGTACALLPVTAMAAEGDLTGLYSSMLQTTRQELNQTGADLALRRAIPQLLQGRTAFPITEEDVDSALLHRLTSLCSKAETEYEATYADCLNVVAQIQDVARRESWIRSVGRDLQMIASSYEREVDGHSGRDNTFSVLMPKAMELWQSGSDKATNPYASTKVRQVDLDEDDFDSEKSSLESALSGLIEQAEGPAGPLIDKGELAAAFARYKDGYFAVQEAAGDSRGSCNDDDEGGGGGELGALTQRWCDIEDALHDAWQKLPQEELEDLDADEIVVFPSITLNIEGAQEVVLWFSQNDAGILWGTPTEAVLPSPSVPNSGYTGAQVGGGGNICQHPFGSRGYLCRPQTPENCPNELPDADGSNITLFACVPHWFSPRQIESGSNSCQVGGWRTPLEPEEMIEDDTPDRDDELEAGKCENCITDLYCDSCDGSLGLTFPKEGKDVIPICIDDSQEEIAYKYVILHELVHAQQKCNLPAGQDPYDSSTKDGCCTAEYYPNVVTCRALIEDGVLDERAYSVEECALLLANGSCSQWEFACTGTPADEDSFNERKKAFWDSIKPGEMGECEDAIEGIEARALSMKESLKLSCTPGCEIAYENTIGNNLCYISQCVEESLEAHRLVPGRMTYVTQDEAYPWDSCMQERSETPDLVAVPPLTRTFLPHYAGREVVEELDTLLCQISGLPRLSPPIVCSFHQSRRTNLPLSSYAKTVASYLGINHESLNRTEDLEMSAQNIGTRMGTVMYQQYMHKAMWEFADLINTAGRLIRSIGDTNLPTKACPRNYTGDCSVFEE